MKLAHYDIVVVGGGINGAGVAQAAAAAGYSVMLIEKTDLAAGTSSASSKLIHGGLRYLESWQFGMVRESLHERSLLARLAPDLVQMKDFYLPIYKGSRRAPALVRTGLSLYAFLAGLSSDARFSKLPRAAWDSLDGLRTSELRAVYRYRDAQTDDELLTRAVMYSAVKLGATIACPAELVKVQLHSQMNELFYRQDDQEQTCSANVLINAAGPWANQVLERVRPTVPQLDVELVQGAHIVIPGELQQGCYYIESPRDGRAIFVLPWKGQIMVGTTETRLKRRPDTVEPLRSEIHYLLQILRYYFPSMGDLRVRQIVDSFAGLRVLPRSDRHVFHRSRETILHADRPAVKGAPRIVSVYGGKLTTYRSTAQKVLRRIRAALPKKTPIARTDELPLVWPGPYE
ncbi:MAG: glycerol-3-phosphate dehydrogenase/oxidase [Gammaproteobacteria bacterium]